MNYLIIDDEPHAIQLLQDHIKSIDPGLNCLGFSYNKDDALLKINKLNPDLIFLDIMLGPHTGFELLNSLPNPNFKIIFTTAYNEFASEAFKHSAIHYLLKPINKEAVKDAIDRLKNSKEVNDYAFLVNAIKTVQEQSQKRLALPNRTGTEFVLQNQIVYCKGSGNYTDVYFIDGSEKLISRPIGQIEKTLDSDTFCRVHKKYLVNLDEVAYLEKGKSPTLHMKTGDKVEVSKFYKETLIHLLKSKIDFINDAIRPS
jgi:two-component system LytT family response regulator